MSDWLFVGLDAIVVAVFLVKFGIVWRWYRRRPTPRPLERLVVATVFLLGAVALATADGALRWLQPAAFQDAMRIIIPFMRAVLLLTGSWLLWYWLDPTRGTE